MGIRLRSALGPTAKENPWCLWTLYSKVYTIVFLANRARLHAPRRFVNPRYLFLLFNFLGNRSSKGWNSSKKYRRATMHRRRFTKSSRRIGTIHALLLAQTGW